MTTTNEPQMEHDHGQHDHAAMHEQEEMCCDGQQTAEEHRRNSPDGKCCIDK